MKTKTRKKPGPKPSLNEGSNAPKVPNVSQTSMGSGDPPRGSDFTVGALNMASEINGGTLLTRPEGHDTAAGKTPRKAKTTASQNSRFSGNKILGRKMVLPRF